jgi:hypothetical protein
MPEFRRCGELYRLFRLDSVGVAMCANDFGDDFWSKSKEERQLYLFGATHFLGRPTARDLLFCPGEVPSDGESDEESDDEVLSVIRHLETFVDLSDDFRDHYLRSISWIRFLCVHFGESTTASKLSKTRAAFA